MLVFSAITLLVTYGIERLQHILPLNPQILARCPQTSPLTRQRALRRYQLAGVYWRVDYELSDADGRARLA